MHGFIVKPSNKRIGIWKLKRGDFYLEQQYIRKAGEEYINYRKIFINGKLDKKGSFFYEIVKSNNAIVLKLYSNNFTNNDSIVINYLLNGKIYTQFLKKCNHFTEVILQNNRLNKNDKIVIKGTIDDLHIINDSTMGRKRIYIQENIEF